MTTISAIQPKLPLERKTARKTGSSRLRGLLRSGSLAFVLIAVAGCSAVPDALNPAEWYNSTVDFFSGEDDQGQVAAQKNPGEGQPFPNLASVPERPKPGVNQGLVADLEGRKYAASIARQGEAPVAMAKTAPAPAPTPVAPAQPAPPATPIAPVTQAPAPAPQPVQAPRPVTAATQVAALPSAPPVDYLAALGDDPFATVIVSSNGIERNGVTEAVAERPVTAANSLLTKQVITASAPAPSLFRARASAPAGTKIATILFGNGSASLDHQDRQILGEVVLLQKERGGMVRVVGHSSSRTRNMDPVRHAMVNYKLSSDRANKIASALISQGLPADVLLVVSRSDSMPLYAENMPSGEAGNRRAEIYFVN